MSPKAAAALNLARIRFELDEVYLAERPAGWERPTTVFGDYHFWWIERGAGLIRINDQAHPVSGGELFLIRPGDHVSAKVDDKKSVRVFFVPFIPSETFLWESLHIPSPIRKNPPELAELFHSVQVRYLALRKSRVPTHLATKTFFFRLLDLLVSESLVSASPHGSGNRQFAVLERLTAFIDKKRDRTFSLDELADLAGVERTTVIRLFKKYLRTTPSRWQNERRLEKARLLLGEAHSVADTARQCGFTSAAGFSRAFKARYQLSPEDYTKTRSPL